MSDRHSFEWDYAKDITADDSTDLDPYPVGLHVVTTAGIIKVDYAQIRS